LSFWLGKTRATAIAARIGQALALAMVAFGLFVPQPLLALVGLFVFFAAGEERASGQAEEGLAQLTAGEVLGPPISVLKLGDDLGDVVDLALRSQQSAFAVVSDMDLLGVVLRDEVLAVAPRLGLRSSIGQVLRRGLPVCDAATPLLTVRERIAETGLPVVVVDDGRFLGLLSIEDLTRIARVTSRLATAGIRRPVPPAPAPADVGGSASG
jgi:CBS domain-containing protein